MTDSYEGTVSGEKIRITFSKETPNIYFEAVNIIDDTVAGSKIYSYSLSSNTESLVNDYVVSTYHDNDIEFDKQTDIYSLKGNRILGYSRNVHFSKKMAYIFNPSDGTLSSYDICDTHNLYNLSDDGVYIADSEGYYANTPAINDSVYKLKTYGTIQQIPLKNPLGLEDAGVVYGATFANNGNDYFRINGRVPFFDIYRLSADKSCFNKIPYSEGDGEKANYVDSINGTIFIALDYDPYLKVLKP
ncbi:hypothetical protein [Dethiothermospora halolimnae]|uniref:hypothetical protein n=1 Tax=Dethiothermospora halolimnae TaxID=3114390 RepID=UPI003CCC2796